MTKWMSSFNRWDSYDQPPQWSNMPFPIFQAAVNEAHEAIQSPIKMVSHCASNAIFPVVQGLANLQRPDGGASPLANISLIIGETAERKSTTDACFFKQHFAFGGGGTSGSEGDLTQSVQLKVWALKKAAIERQLAAALDDEVALRDLTEVARAHLGQRPSKEPTFLYQDTSLVSLKLGLADFPSACIHSTEGMSILTGPLFKEQGLLCSLYSGEPHRYNRKGINIVLSDKRLSVSAHSHPRGTRRFFARFGDDYRDSGLAARMTFCLLDSNIGFHRHDAVAFSTENRDRFNDRCGYLLRTNKRAVKRGTFRRRDIKFSPSAEREYLAFANWTEVEMRANGRFRFARDHASRLPDKIGRFSATMHHFEDFEGDVSVDTFMAARAFFIEESSDFLHLFNYLPSDQFRADQLANWLRTRPLDVLPNGAIGMKKSYIEGFGPEALRRKSKLDPVLRLLEQQGLVHLETWGRTVYVCSGPGPGYRAAVIQSLAVPGTR